MHLDYDNIITQIKGKTIPRPPMSTLSGHAAGEPFEKHVYSILKGLFPDNIFKQYEYLNKLYSDNPKAITYAERSALFNSTLHSFLLQRGKEAVVLWSPDHQFEEKQNDTADILYINNNVIDIVDVKTRNIGVAGQPPNIISAFKVANAMKIMIDNQDFDSLDIVYIEVNWLLEGNNLVAKDVYVADLFKSNPSKLYINWAAAMQIQFHVCDLDQSFTGSKEEWAHAYLTTFYKQALKRSEDMKRKFADPFKNYINE